MATRKLPSKTQAKLIARLWALDEVVKVGGYVTSTEQACLKNGWLAQNGVDGLYSNGMPYSEYILSDTALMALECYFQECRFKERVP